MPSRLQVKPVFTGGYDDHATKEYMYNHKLNPKRYPLPKPRAPEPDTGPRADIWAEATSPEDKIKLQAMEHRVKQGQVKPPKTFEECMAIPGVSTNGIPQECIDPVSKRRFVQGKEGFYIGNKHYRPKRVRFADRQKDENEKNIEQEAISDRSMTMFQQMGHDLKGTWNDLKNFNSLPATSSMDKIRYTFTRENRTWSVIACIGVFILIVCFIGGLIYWAQGSSSSSASVSNNPVILGGFTPFTHSAGYNGGNTNSYPLISIR